MKLCATCQNKYPDDANFCPREQCAGPDGPHRLDPIIEPAARFVQVSRIGGGASGEVWQASDSQSGSAVAYKVVAPEALPTTLAVDRALRELRQLQRASSPRIVKVIDFGKTADGKVFTASELVGGEPLDQVVGRSGPFPLDRAKHVLAQVGEALLDAQKVGVVHRDLSAKNILVTGDGDVKVINFAVARPVSATVFGVPEFMSPEQAEGKLIDQRSNTFSVAAILYFMLTGAPPNSGDTPEATMQAVLKGEIVPPSIKLGGGGLTAEVDRVVLKALERNSSRRPLTMRQFLADVAALIVTDQPSGAAAGAGGATREGGFVKTMVFAGGATEVQKLVAQAVAARQAAGAPAAVPEPVPAPATPAVIVADSAPNSGLAEAPAPARSSGMGSRHGSAVSATMIALPVSPGSAAPAAGPPAGAPKDSAAHTPPVAPAGQGGANFRETLWFKKGDVDQMVADARAKVAAMADAKKVEVVESVATATTDLPGGTGELKPLEDRYVDDGTVTTDDRKNFSLDQSGATSTKTGPARKVPIPGERMSDNEVIDEIGGGKRLKIILIAAAAALSLVVVVVLMVRGKGKAEVVPAPAAPVAAPATTPAAPAPEPVKGTADEAKGAAKGEANEDAPRPARPAAAANANKKKVVAAAKKKAPPAAKKGHR